MNKENLISTIILLVLSVSCFIFAIWLLPKNCTLFVSNVPGPQMCHTLPIDYDCFDTYCKDTETELLATIIAIVGICLFSIPFVVLSIRENLKQSVELPKLFD